MLIPYENPDDFMVEITSQKCPHHQRQPWDMSFPGCTCSGGYSRRPATPAENAANVKAREAEEERRRKHMADYDAGRLSQSAASHADNLKSNQGEKHG